MAEPKYTPAAAAHDLLAMLDKAKEFRWKPVDRWNQTDHPTIEEAMGIVLKLLHDTGHSAVVAVYWEVVKHLPGGCGRICSDTPWITPDTTAEVGCVNWGWMANPEEVAGA